MESQFKPGFDGTQQPASQVYNARATPTSSTAHPMRLPAYILRIIAIVLTFIAAIVMGVAKETATTTVTDPSTGQTDVLSGTAKSTYSSALVYFIVVNVIVFLYSSVSLVLSLMNRMGSSNIELPLSVADLVIAAFLFSANGAATAVSVIAEKGNSHLGWDKICDSVGKFCGHVVSSIVLSMIASVAYLLLVALVVIRLHK